MLPVLVDETLENIYFYEASYFRWFAIIFLLKHTQQKLCSTILCYKVVSFYDTSHYVALEPAYVNVPLARRLIFLVGIAYL